MSSNCSGGSTDEVISLVGDVGDITKRPLESGIGGGMAAAATLTSDGSLGLFGNAAADDMKKRPYSGNGCSDSFGVSSDKRAQKKMTTTSVLGEKSGLACSPDDLLLLCTELEARCAHSEQQLAKMEQEKQEELAKAAERQREELAEAAEVRRVLAELRTFKKNAASKLAALEHRTNLEAAPFSDDEVWDPSFSAGRAAKFRALVLVREGITRACARKLPSGSYVASPLKRLALLKVLMEDYWGLAVSKEQAAAEDLTNHEMSFSSAVPVFSISLPYRLIPTLLSCPLSFIPS